MRLAALTWMNIWIPWSLITPGILRAKILKNLCFQQIERIARYAGLAEGMEKRLRFQNHFN